MALPPSAVITKKIILPGGLTEQELEVQVETEANQYIPFSLDEVSLDFCVIGPSTTSVGDVEVLIAASCSKNFGIYRERTGVLIALTEPARRAVVQGNLAFLNRQNYSFPPDHGARLVTMILEDQALTADWKAELEEVRQNMLGLRKALADELRRAGGR